VVSQYTTRVMDRDRSILVLVHRDAVPSKPPVLLRILDCTDSGYAGRSVSGSGRAVNETAGRRGWC